MINSVGKFLYSNANAGPKVECAGSGGMLAYELAKPDEVRIALSMAHVALKDGHFQVDPTIDVPEIDRETQKTIAIGNQHSEGDTELVFGTWTDTTQEPPVASPALLHFSTSLGGSEGFFAKLVGREARVVVLPPSKTPKTTE